MGFSEIIDKNSELPIPVKWWTKYAFHYTDITNALSILQEGMLYSRLEAQTKHLMKNDNASYQVIDMTSSRAQSYVRFYFRPLTPTQYNNEGYKHPSLRFSLDPHANVPVPIFFAFDLKKFLTDPKVTFSETGQAGYGAPRFSGEEQFACLPFEKIYSDGYVEEDERKYRHAELSYPNAYPIGNSLEAILCRNEFEQSMLFSLLKNTDLSLFYKYKHMIKVCREKMFEKNGLFIQGINLNNQTLTFQFSEDYAKVRYAENIMKKNEIKSLDPIKAIFSFQWKRNRQILAKSSVEVELNYLSTKGIVFNLPPVAKATILIVEVLFNDDLIGYREIMLTNII